MKARALASPVLLCLLWPGGAGAAERLLRGSVVLEASNGNPQGAAGVTVILTVTGDRDTTDSLGLFRLHLSERFRPGEPVNLSIDPNSKKGWRLYFPLDGDTHVPADTDTQLIKLWLLPEGSKRFWTDERIEKFLKDKASEARIQAIRDGQGARVDMGRSIKDWAEAYGLSASEARGEIDKWIRDVEKRHDDTEKLALTAFAKGNFSQASALLSQLAHKTDEQLEQNLGALKAKSVRQHESAADADYNDKAYLKALAHYERALKSISKEEEPHHWATLMLSVAAAHVSQAEVDQGAAISQHFEAARATIDATLAVCTRQKDPQDWARAQNSLGNALLRQGEREGGKESARLLGEAVQAYQAALEVRTREQVPQDWATTQNNLGNVLMRQGERDGGSGAIALLGEAVRAYYAVLEVRTREQFPLERAATWTNLALALLDLSDRMGSAQAELLLGEALTACRAALEVHTREHFPQEWANAQNILGLVLLRQGEHAAGEASVRLLDKAATAFRAALKVRTHEQWPQLWATTQGNLANALRSQGQRVGGEEAVPLLREAVGAYRSTLEVFTREQLPQPRASVQYNLGDALRSLGGRVTGDEAVRLLEEAITAYRAALGVFGNKDSSPYWEPAQASLVDTQLLLAETHAALGAFADVERVLKDIDPKFGLDLSAAINLRTLELLALQALQRPEVVSSRLDELLSLVGEFPWAQGRAWRRQEIRMRARTDPRLASFQDWLPRLVEAVNTQRREDLFLVLYDARKQLSR